MGADQVRVSHETSPTGMTGQRDPNPAWHGLKGDEAVARLGSDPVQGLEEAEVQARLARYGENRLAEKPPRSRWSLLVDQFKSLLILVLLAAAVLAGAIGDLKDAIVILVVVLLNALLGFWQEHRAEATLAALKKMLSPEARVRRDGRVQTIPAAGLVPGDVVLLEAGDRVPADGRLLATHGVEIEEAALTGESQPAAKDASMVAPADAPLAERPNMAYMNTVVTRGRAEMLVTATGMATEMGRLTNMLEEAEPGPTPLQIQLDALGRRLAMIAGAVVSLILVLGLLRGQPWVETLLTSIALAVAAIPEGLPAVVTVTLALGMHRMAKNRAIVKKLSAVETLGSTTVICSDKTGTLTLNQMTVRAVWFRGRRYHVSGEGYGASGEIVPVDEGGQTDLTPLLQAAALCNDSRIRNGELIGDPTEGALLALAAKGGFDPIASGLARIAELHFDSAHKFMATFHRDGDTVRMFVKGAPDILLDRAAAWLDADGRESPLDALARATIVGENEAMAHRAMRVLAMATKTIPLEAFDPQADLMAYMEGLTFLGLAGLIDPPRPEAREAIRLCRRAGIQVKMITGDHRLTAAAIARDLGLEGEAVSGRELDAMDDAALGSRIEGIAVFARVAPEHKVRIVQRLKALGHVVAMTGDGVNDAPALKNADIGVAMGITGTEVTKEAATMVLTDDNFATIVGAVKEGRVIYDNLVKFVRFQLSTNMGAIQAVLGASLMGWSTPFTAIQILWINIIMDGPPAMTLGVEPGRPRVMDSPPRPPDARVLTTRRLALLLFYGFIMAAGTLTLFYSARPQGEAYALTLAFTTFVLFQFFNIFNARAERDSAFAVGFLRNRWLWLALAGVLALQVVVVHWGPAQAVFDTVDLRLADWLLAAAVASSVLWIEELRKLGMRLYRLARASGRPLHLSGN